MVDSNKDWGKYWDLYECAKVGDTKGMERALYSGADVNAKIDGGGRTPLHMTVISPYKVNGDTITHIYNKNSLKMDEVVRKWLKKYVFQNKPRDQIEIPLDDVEQLLNELIEIANYDRLEGMKWLLDHRADVNAKDNDGNTPVHVAAWYGDYFGTLLLLQYNPDLTIRNIDGKTAAEVAEGNGYREIAALIKKYEKKHEEDTVNEFKDVARDDEKGKRGKRSLGLAKILGIKQ